MSKFQFHRAVRIAPAPGKGKPVIFAAGSVVPVTDPHILNHPHFKKFKKAGAISEYTAPVQPKKLAPGKLTSTKQVNESARDGRVPGVLPKGGQLATTQKALAKAKAAAKKATKVAPETEVGGDDEEADEQLDSDVESSADDSTDDDGDESPAGSEDAESDEEEESSDSDASDEAEEVEEAEEPEEVKPAKKKKAKKGKSK
jgi:hypothetical protein